MNNDLPKINLKIFSKVILAITAICIIGGHYLSLSIATYFISDVNIYTFNTQHFLIFAVSSITSNIGNFFVAFICLYLARHLSLNPWICTVLGLYNYYFSIVFLLLAGLVFVPEKTKEFISKNTKKVLTLSIILALIGYLTSPISKVSDYFIMNILIKNQVGVYKMLESILNVFVSFVGITLNIGLSVWVNKFCKQTNIYPKAFTLLTIISGLFAPIVLFIVFLFSTKTSNDITNSEKLGLDNNI